VRACRITGKIGAAAPSECGFSVPTDSFTINFKASPGANLNINTKIKNLINKYFYQKLLILDF
jgi:hypothetical protein